MIELLLARRATVNSGFRGRTPLMLAALTGQAETIRALVAGGASVNARDNSGCTALQLATEEDHADVARLLKQIGERE